MNKSLSNKIYYLTFALAIGVILLHASYLECLNPALDGYDFSYIVQRLFLVIGDACVPTFFVISGYLLFTKFTLKDYPRMLLGKLFSLVIPYFIWSIAAFIFMDLIYPPMNGAAIDVSFKSVVVDILLANEYPHLWFIRPLLVYFICSPLLYFILKYLKKWSILIPIGLFFVYMFFRPVYGGILLCIPLFFVGSYLSYFKVQITNQFKPRLFGIIALLILLSLSVVFTLTHTEFEDYAYYCYRFISPLIVWIAIDVIKPLFKKENILDIFKTSAFIYFSHLFIVNGLKVLFEMFVNIDSNYNCALLFFIISALSIGIDLCVTYLLMRFAKPVYKFLGGR